MNKKKKIFDFLVYILIFIFVFGFIIYIGRHSAFGKFVSSVENKTFDIRQNIILARKKITMRLCLLQLMIQAMNI